MTHVPNSKMTKAIAEIIGKDTTPLNTVTKAGFTALGKTLGKQYSLKCSTYFGQAALPELFKTCRQSCSGAKNS